MITITLKDYIISCLNFEGTYFDIPKFSLETDGNYINFSIDRIWKNNHFEDDTCTWKFEFKPKNSTHWHSPSYRHDSMDGLIFGNTPEDLLEEMMNYIEIELTGEELGTINKPFN